MIEEEVIGYKYDTEQEAKIARNECAIFYGLLREGNKTHYWANYDYAHLNEIPFWYIKGDDSITEILGESSSFVVEREGL